MSKPEGSLSPIQFHVMSAVWDHGEKGATVSEVWDVISEDRSVIRSTVQNLMERLATRGWLTRRELKSGLHYRATVPRDRVEKQVVSEFVDGFFGGSASHLVRGLLGSGKVSKEELDRLRELLDDAEKGEQSS